MHDVAYKQHIKTFPLKFINPNFIRVTISTCKIDYITPSDNFFNAKYTQITQKLTYLQLLVSQITSSYDMKSEIFSLPMVPEGQKNLFVAYSVRKQLIHNVTENQRLSHLCCVKSIMLLISYSMQ